MSKMASLGKYEVNKFGVPYHRYRIDLIDGRQRVVDRGDEGDWGNIQECYTDWNGKTHRACVGWGDADEWTEIVSVVDLETGRQCTPLTWARRQIWPYVREYSA